MTLYSQSTQSTGTSASFQISAVPSGLQWTVSQMTVETIPFRAGARVVVRMNGRYLTSSVNGGQASAQGPPFFRLQAGDELEFSWTGVQANDNCIATLLYEESPWGTISPTLGQVV